MYSTTINRMSLRAPQPPDIVFDGQPLFESKFVATLSGDVSSTDFKASSDVFGDKNDPEALAFIKKMREATTSKTSVRDQVEGTFGFLSRDIAQGSELGRLVLGDDFLPLLRACGVKERVPAFRVVGMVGQALVGTLSWRPSGNAQCSLALDATKAVDGADGRPLSTILKVSIDVRSTNGSKSHTDGVGAISYTYASGDSNVTAREVAKPSQAKCSEARNTLGNIAYPESSISAHEQGKVLLKVKVGASGGVEEVGVAKSSGYPRLDEWAVAGAHAWKFDVDACAGLWELLPVDFNLP